MCIFLCLWHSPLLDLIVWLGNRLKMPFTLTPTRSCFVALYGPCLLTSRPELTWEVRGSDPSSTPANLQAFQKSESEEVPKITNRSRAFLPNHSFPLQQGMRLEWCGRCTSLTGISVIRFILQIKNSVLETTCCQPNSCGIRCRNVDNVHTPRAEHCLWSQVTGNFLPAGLCWQCDEILT